MYIVAIAWMYVVLMMSITEHSIVAGIMTFFMYGVLPLTIILYLMRTPHRRRQRQATEQLQNQVQVAEPASKKDPEDTAHPT